MWTQLNLFDEQTDIDFAMSLTSRQLAELKHREEHTYYWIKQIREVIQRYNAMKRITERNYFIDMERAMTAPHKRY